MAHQEFVTKLLQKLQTIMFEDISKIPEGRQHIIAKRIEQLHDVARGMNDKER